MRGTPLTAQEATEKVLTKFDQYLATGQSATEAAASTANQLGVDRVKIVALLRQEGRTV